MTVEEHMFRDLVRDLTAAQNKIAKLNNPAELDQASSYISKAIEVVRKVQP